MQSITQRVRALGALFKNKCLLQGSLIYLQQVKEVGFISKVLSPPGRHYLVNYTLISSLQLGTFILQGSYQAHPVYSWSAK